MLVFIIQVMQKVSELQNPAAMLTLKIQDLHSHWQLENVSQPYHKTQEIEKGNKRENDFLIPL